MSDEKAVAERQEMIKSKFVEIQKIVFSSGFTVGEISDVIRALQNGLNSIGVNIPVSAPVEPKVEEVKE